MEYENENSYDQWECIVKRWTDKESCYAKKEILRWMNEKMMTWQVLLSYGSSA